MLEREVVFLLDIKRIVPQERVRVEIMYFIYYSYFLKRVEKQESERVREESVGGNKIIKGQ